MMDFIKYKFDEIIEDCTKYGVKIPTNDYLEKGRFPIIDQGQNFIAGYSNSDNGIYSDVPAIIFGDHTRVFKYIDFPFFLGADGVKILKAKKEISYKYLFYYFLQAKFPNTGYARHYKWLKELEIPVPPIEKQKSIVKNLDKVTKIIKVHKILLEKYDILIKSRFIEMFGDPKINSSKLPTKKFIEIVKLQRGFDLPVQERNQNGSYNVYGSNGPLDKHDSFKVKAPGIVTGRSGTLGNVYYVMEDYWPLNTTLFSVDTHNNNVIYLKYLLELFDLSRFSEGAGVPTLNRNIVHEKEIIDVSLQHQDEFASFVQQIDKSKFAVQKSLEKAETLYKSLMQEYFG